MRIALDARTVYRPQRRGTGKNLIDLYAHLAEARPGWRVTAYHRARPLTPDLAGLLPRRVATPKRIEMMGDRYDAWGRLRLPMAARRDRVDVLHCPANMCPAWMPVPTVVTIHDLIPLQPNSGVPDGFKRRFESSVRTACRKAAVIITPSQFTRQQLLDGYKADAHRVVVNPWAADSRMRPVTPRAAEATLLKYGVRRPFVLHMGAADPRKNTRRLLHAWSISDIGRSGCCHLLVIGLDGPTARSLQQTVEQFGIAGTVRLCGFADEDDMAALFSIAELIAYPSLAEGFGLPILDAWSAKTPILVSDTTSLPEVAGDAAAIVDPTDACGIARTMTRILRDKHTRMELVQRGLKRLEQYTWRSTAQRFAGVLESAVGGHTLSRAAA